MTDSDRPVDILIVDDDPEDVELLRERLSLEGIHEAIVADHDPRRALARLVGDAAERPGIVLLDLNMPVMDGFEVLERLRDQGAGGGRPEVLVLTSSTRPEDRERALSLGARDFLEKPVDVHSVRVIEELVAECRERRRSGP